MSRILGIDFGEKRWGLALSDETHTLASPYGVYERATLDDDLAHLQKVIAQEKIAEIVLGLPLNMDGSTGAKAQEVLAFQTLLAERLQISVYLYDERLTTTEAERILLEADVQRRKRRKVRDALAAVLILQGFLDSQRTT